MSWTTPRTWVAGEDVTAAQLNQHVRDNLDAIGGGWTNFTPSWTASSSNPDIGNGSIGARHMRAGSLVSFKIELVMGSTTNYGSGGYSLTLPVPPHSSTAKLAFGGSLHDSSAGSAVTSIYPIVGVLMSGSTMELAAWPVTAGNTFRVVNATNLVTLATGDRITIAGTYEAA